MQIQDLIEVGIEAGGEGAGRGGFAGADFAGEQAGAVMIDQELEPRLDLGPGLRSKQLLGIGAVAEGSFLEAEEGFYHGTDSSSSSFFSWSSSTKLMPVGSGAAAWAGFGGRQLAVDDGIDEARRALRFSLEIDLDLGGVERIEAHFDGFAGQMRRRFVEAVLQQEGAIAAHQAIQAMEEEAAQIGGRRQLTDVLDIALPAQQRGGPQGAVLGAVIGVFDPGPQTVVQLFQRERLFADPGWPGTVRARCGSSVRFFRGPRADTGGVCTIRMPSEAAMRASCWQR